MSQNSITLHIHKQNFKFSSAHFLIFDSQRAEKLHGHNYQVQFEMTFPQDSALMKEQGFCIDFYEIKKWLKAKLDAWDEHVLLPETNSEFKFHQKGESLEVRFRDRFYVFPRNEVILLPIVNTSVELLSLLIAEEAMKQYRSLGIQKISVRVEETAGQGATSTLIPES